MSLYKGSVFVSGINVEAGTNTEDATITADMVLEGEIAYGPEGQLVGTLPDMAGTHTQAVATLDDSTQRLQMDIPKNARYNSTSKLYAAWSAIRDLIGLTAAKLANGVSILGVTGSYKGVGNATADKVLSGSTFSTASLSNATGTMVNNGTTANQTLNCGSSFTVKKGYHNSDFTVTANSLASQTDGDAVAANILLNKTAFVDGSKVTGSMPIPANNTSITLTSTDLRKVVIGKNDAGSEKFWITPNSDGVSRVCMALPTTGYYSEGTIVGVYMLDQGAKTSSLNCGGSYTIPAGYHNGSGKITANSLASQTSADAVAANILSGKTAWVNGTKITGTMTVSSVLSFSLGSASTYRINCVWYNPNKGPFSGVMIRYSTSGYPNSTTAGSLGYKGACPNSTAAGGYNAKYVTGLYEDTRYYFSIWGYAVINGAEVFSSTYLTANGWTDCDDCDDCDDCADCGSDCMDICDCDGCDGCDDNGPGNQ